jgi:heme-degrading monooxygenase HmoA
MEVRMFARIFRVDLKPGQGDAYARAIEQKVIPILEKFRGFRDEIAMVSADGKEGIGVSFWESQQDAEAYDRKAYAEVRKALEPFAAATPELHEYQVTTSTVHAAARAK